jgi:TonB family protein
MPVPAPDCRQLTVAQAAGSPALCQAIDTLRTGNAEAGADRKRQQLQAAAELFSRAMTQLTLPDLKIFALESLARLYDAAVLNEPHRLEQALRDLAPLVPTDSSPLRRIAAVQEEMGSTDAAEQSLLSARQQTPDDPEVYAALSKFYGRKAEAIEKARATPAGDADGTPRPPKPESDGYYRVGDSVPAPEPIDSSVFAEYPFAARNAGVEGDVMVEIKIDEHGAVTDARVVNSVPGLDEEALKTARRWRFAPTVIDGRPVPTKMILGVRFRADKV